jgi:hypothetical protein
MGAEAGAGVEVVHQTFQRSSVYVLPFALVCLKLHLEEEEGVRCLVSEVLHRDSFIAVIWCKKTPRPADKLTAFRPNQK